MEQHWASRDLVGDTKNSERPEVTVKLPVMVSPGLEHKDSVLEAGEGREEISVVEVGTHGSVAAVDRGDPGPGPLYPTRWMQCRTTSRPA